MQGKLERQNDKILLIKVREKFLLNVTIPLIIEELPGLYLTHYAQYILIQAVSCLLN